MVPAGSNITVMFPTDFTFATQSPSVTTLLINNQPTSFNFSVISNNVTISNAITADTAIANVSITIDNVLNPYPAVTTSPFLL